MQALVSTLRPLFVLSLCLTIGALGRYAHALAADGMRTTQGLQCTIAADDSLVHDCFAMTTDPLGRPVVSGPGYVRTLIDDQGDGIYDRGVLWTTVNQGAQGLWRESDVLYYVADQGLWKSVDRNNDLKADGRPELVFKLPTGGEHDAHAIRRGPDGFWYLTAGNFSNPQMMPLLNDKDSPILRPKAGTLWRISPDFKTRSVWSHGLRNIYDFDFLPNGELVSYDSDEEREMTLPTYRPTRVQVLSPGSDAGWVSTAWIESDVHLTMPLNLASLGRGSPTGVCVYQHDQLGERFKDAVIVLDWTFGRVIAVFPKLSVKESNDSTKSQVPANGLCPWEVILEPSGTEGFAPTDVCVTPEGDLLVCTGGRGTRGTIYRISGNSESKVAADKKSTTPSRLVAESTKRQTDEKQSTESAAVPLGRNNTPAEPRIAARSNTMTTSGLSDVKFAFKGQNLDSNSLPANRASTLASILSAPCPWESWSTNEWLKQINEQSLADVAAVLAGELTVAQTASKNAAGTLRVRAAQVLVFTQTPLPAAMLIKVASEDSELARSAAWYALGRGQILASATELKQIVELQKQTRATPTASLVNDWNAVIEYADMRSQWEAIGLRKWACIGNDREWQSERTNQQSKRSLQQIESWAYARQSQSTTSATNQIDVDLANAIYGWVSSSNRGAARLDAAAFDRLANSIRSGRFKTDASEILTALCFAQSSLVDPRQIFENDRNPESSTILDGYRSKLSASFSPALRTGWSSYCLNMADLAMDNGWTAVEMEAVRTVAFFRPDSSAVLDRLLERIDETSHPTADINVLCVIAASDFKRSDEQSKLIAVAYHQVGEKVKSRSLPTDNRWSVRQQQLLEALTVGDSRFLSNLIAVLATQSTTNIDWVQWLPLTEQRQAATAITQRLMSVKSEQWTVDQLKNAGRFAIAPALAAELRKFAIDNLDSPLKTKSEIASAETSVNNQQLAAAIVELLSKTPTTADYDVFLQSSAMPDRLLRVQGWNGLRKLPIDNAALEIQAIALLSAANNQSPLDGFDLNQAAARLKNIAVRLQIASVPTARDAWPAWQSFFSNHISLDSVRAQWADLNLPPADWIDLVATAQKLSGDPNRGGSLFQRGQCGNCHNSAQAIGPSLTGVTRRFSYEDLFRAIYEPDRDISDRFRATKVLTSDGKVIVGMVTFDGNDALTLKLADGSTVQIATDEIEERVESSKSLMPEKLLQGLTAEQLSDLYAHLKDLQ